MPESPYMIVVKVVVDTTAFAALAGNTFNSVLVQIAKSWWPPGEITTLYPSFARNCVASVAGVAPLAVQ